MRHKDKPKEGKSYKFPKYLFENATLNDTVDFTYELDDGNNYHIEGTVVDKKDVYITVKIKSCLETEHISLPDEKEIIDSMYDSYMYKRTIEEFNRDI